MRPRLLLVLACVTAVFAAQPLRAEDAPQSCDVSDNLLATESALPKTAEAIQAGKLDILVIGSRSSTIVSADANAYPARLQAALQAAVPKLNVALSVEIQVKKTAEEAVTTFPKLMEAKKPTLVIWQTGTVDAMRSVDPDDFRSAVDEGVVALQKAGADVVLINPQYSPRTETMISVPPYIDNMRAVAQEHEFRCSIASASCISGMIRVISIFSAQRTGLISPSVFTIASAARCRSSSSMPRMGLRRGRIRVFG